MSESTQGPWKWMINDTHPGVDDDSSLVSESGARIMDLGDCYPNGGQPNEADASLIAAAPDLLDALRALLPAIMSKSAMMDKNDWLAVERANAAIAKAKGEKR